MAKRQFLLASALSVLTFGDAEHIQQSQQQVEKRHGIEKGNNICGYIPIIVNDFPNPAMVSSFCSSLLDIKTATITVSTTKGAPHTSTSTVDVIVPSDTTVTESVTATCAESGTHLRKRGTNTAVKPAGSVAAYACSTLGPNYYPCGARGSLRSPKPITSPSGLTTLERCRDACLSNTKCQSFSFGSQTCKHYSDSLTSQGLQSSERSETVLYNRMCFQNCRCISGGPTNKPPPACEPSGWAYPTKLLSSACGCLKLPTPTSTTTTTATNTRIVVTTVTTTRTTVTSTRTATETATTIPFVQQGSYTVTLDSGAQDTYHLYPLFDFYAGNLAAGYCGLTSNPYETGRGNFTCHDFDDCIGICSQYNAAAEEGDGLQKCLGVSFSTEIPNCYLKYAIPGDGADRCEVVEHEYRVDSAVLAAEAA